MGFEERYTLAELQEVTGANGNLITFLIQEKEIPFRRYGKAKVVNKAGFTRLRRALAEYAAKVRRNHERASEKPAKAGTRRSSKVAKAS